MNSLGTGYTAPGVVFIGSERVEYLDIDITNNTESNVAILYMNSNDGGTWTEDDIINSVENRLLIMSGDVKHASITQTDEKVRILYNINYDGTTSN